MTPEERQVITDIFERLKAAENHPRDPEAERLISDLVARQPYAPYAMAQAIYVNEQALANLHQRVEALERDLQQAREEAQARPQAGGFLSSLFGGPSAPPAARPAQTAPPRPYPQQGYGASGPAPRGPMSGVAPQPGGPWGGQPAYGQTPYGQNWGGPPQGGGFLQSALSTAAGVAGGMVLANALTSAFGHHSGAGLESGLGSGLGSFSSSGSSLPGFTSDSANRQDLSSQDDGRAWNSSDHDRPVDASFDGSQTSSDPDDDGSADDSGNFDDLGSSDDSGFSGDV